MKTCIDTIAVDGAASRVNAVKPKSAKSSNPLKAVEADGYLIAFGEEYCAKPRSLDKPSVDGDEAIAPSVALEEAIGVVRLCYDEEEIYALPFCARSWSSGVNSRRPPACLARLGGVCRPPLADARRTD